MSYMLQNAENNPVKTSETVETKTHIISEENFALLKSYQYKIFEATEVTPSLRKILNSLITKENLELVATSIIQSLT